MTCDQPGRVNLSLGATSKLRHSRGGDRRWNLRLTGRAPSHVEPSYRQIDDAVHYSDDLGMGMTFALHVHVRVEGNGIVEAADEKPLRVRGADAVVLVDRRRHQLRRLRPATRLSDVDPRARVATALAATEEQPYAAGARRPISPTTSRSFGAWRWTWARPGADLPTDERIRRYAAEATPHW